MAKSVTQCTFCRNGTSWVHCCENERRRSRQRAKPGRQMWNAARCVFVLCNLLQGQVLMCVHVYALQAYVDTVQTTYNAPCSMACSM